MAEKKSVKFKVLKKNSYGHRFILEPKERIKFREKCKYNDHAMCEKHFRCYVDDGVLIGCTANVDCPRCHGWDRRHGLEKPYTMVANEYPDLKPTPITWHPAIQSPGKRRVVMAFVVKGRPTNQYSFEEVQFLSPGVEPATCAFKTEDGTKKLAVAWAYYDEITKGIEEWMIRWAEYHAWGWWPDKEK